MVHRLLNLGSCVEWWPHSESWTGSQLSARALSTMQADEPVEEDAASVCAHCGNDGSDYTERDSQLLYTACGHALLVLPAIAAFGCVHLPPSAAASSALIDYSGTRDPFYAPNALHRLLKAHCLVNPWSSSSLKQS